LNALSKLEGLKVAGRISSFSFKDKSDVSIGEIARELNVTTILNGSIRKNENKIRVTANLVNAIDGFQIWSETYDEELNDIFQIQEKIATNIVQKFQLSHSIKSKQSLFGRQTSNLEAYEKYLEGKFYANKSADGLEDARLAFEQAIYLDSNYVQAIVGLAETYFSMGFYDLAPKVEFYEKSRKALIRAIALDPNNGDAFNQLGFLNFVGDYDWDAAMTNFAKANIISENAENSSAFAAIMHPTAKNQERA
jgi:hypothetical protein